MLRWGILGAGGISGKFVDDLISNNKQGTKYKHQVVSIGSSSTTKGEKFIKEHGITAEFNYGFECISENYEAFYKDTEIDVVYVGTPHPFHVEQVKQCLNNGKHVLCEKPFVINAKEAKELKELAKAKNLFLMEAVWTRFIPVVQQLQSLLFEKKILGDLKTLMCNFSFLVDKTKVPLDHRMRKHELAGGTLLDIGIYCITYARLLLDTKLGADHTDFSLKSQLTMDEEDNVDFASSILMLYDNGTHAVLTTSLYRDIPIDEAYLTLQGTKGSVQMFARNMAKPDLIKIVTNDGETIELKDDNSVYNGMIYEANAVYDDIALKLIEDKTIPLDETILVMEIMDSVREANGFKYNFE